MRAPKDDRAGRSAVPVVPSGSSAYFGLTLWSPPGLPGGGITGVVPGLGAGARVVISGSMPLGGRMTPSVRSSLSLSVPPEPVEPVLEGSDGATFSGIVFWGAGIFGACCG